MKSDKELDLCQKCGGKRVKVGYYRQGRNRMYWIQCKECCDTETIREVVDEETEKGHIKG